MSWYHELLLKHESFLQGWTRAFSRVSEVGVGAYLGYFVLYMTSVEFGVYWMHRLLHEIRFGYT